MAEIARIANTHGESLIYLNLGLREFAILVKSPGEGCQRGGVLAPFAFKSGDTQRFRRIVLAIRVIRS